MPIRKRTVTVVDTRSDAVKISKPNKPTKLRKSITPGTVVILLAGRHRGKRVVVLKQLDSGLLLVTGPFRLNGVPLRRVNQAYVIATSTKIEVGAVDAKFDDKYFAAEKGQKKSVSEGKSLSDNKVQDQKAVDKAIIQAAKTTPFLKDYLSTPFSLQKGQFPHKMKF